MRESDVLLRGVRGALGAVEVSGLGEPLAIPGPLLTFAIPNEEAKLSGFQSLPEQSISLQQLSGQ